MAAAWAQWDHVTKVDPDKPLHNGDTYAGIADTGTDAIIIGGTTNVTEARVQPILDALSSTEIPIFVEPTYRPSSSHTEALSGYLLPIVLNADDPLWITGAHHEWVRSSILSGTTSIQKPISSSIRRHQLRRSPKRTVILISMTSLPMLNSPNRSSAKKSSISSILAPW